MEDSIKPKAVKQVPTLRKIFINEMNTRFNHILINQLRTDLIPEKHVTKIEFTGTRKSSSDMKLPFKFIPKEVIIDPNGHYDNPIFQNNDIFIFNLEGSDYKEVEYVIKGLKTLNHTNQKNLILISSIMTWARTPPKIREDNDTNQEENEENNVNIDSAENIESEDEEFLEPEEQNESTIKLENSGNNEKYEDEIESGIPKPKILYFKDKDYVLRVPSEKYYKFKMLETLAMSSSNINPKLTTYVVCPGLTYGQGEDIFYEYFKMAWLQDPEYLPILGEGKNIIPTIHIQDLVSLIQRIIENPPKQKYIFAVDRTKNKSLKNIIESISKSTGTGRFKKIHEEKNSIPSFEELSIDIKCKTSKVFEDEKNEDEEEEEFEGRKFKWHCEFGISENLEKLRKEFTSLRNLSPVKILVTGPPASGKTLLSHKLSKFFNLPVYNISTIVEMGKALPESDPLGEEIKSKIEELRDKMLEELEQNNSNQNISNSNSSNTTIARENLNPRLPDELIRKILKKFLSSNICKNRGYILDGYPRFYKDCHLTFYDIDLEKNEDDLNRFIKMEEIFPNSIIKLNCKNDRFLKDRIKNNPKLAISSPHYTNESITRRIKLYRELNESDKGDLSISDLFRENNVDIFEINCDENSIDSDENIIFEKSKIFVERNGKINNYQTHDFDEVNLNKEKWNNKNEDVKNLDTSEVKE
jgi:adenylate kinase